MKKVYQLKHVFLTVWCFLLFGSNIHADDDSIYYILPDKLDIDTVLGTVPQFVVEEDPDGFVKAKVIFEVDYAASFQFLIEQNPEFFDKYLAIELPVEIIKFESFFLNQNNQPNIVSSVKDTKFVNSILIEYEFQPELTLNNVQDIITNNSLFGFVDLKLVCPQDEHLYCDEVIHNIPVYNQFREDDIEQEAYNKFFTLSEYRNFLYLGQQQGPLSSFEEMDNLVREQLLFFGTCAGFLSDFELAICELIQENSENFSLTEAVVTLAAAVYPSSIFDDDLIDTILTASIFDVPKDADGDGYLDHNDAFPNDPTEWSDLDSDGIGDNSDPDKDGDGVANANDVWPLDSRWWSDNDRDAMADQFEIRYGLDTGRNDASEDPDGDGISNYEEFLRGSSPVLNEAVLVVIITSVLL